MDLTLEDVANGASVLTAVMAAAFFVGYKCRRRSKRVRLETYLKRDKATAKPPLTGKRTVVHLMAKLKFTEDEVFEACFDSKHVACKVAVDPDTKRASEILFEFDEEGKG